MMMSDHSQTDGAESDKAGARRKSGVDFRSPPWKTNPLSDENCVEPTQAFALMGAGVCVGLGLEIGIPIRR
ncbi:hypothetical protein SAY87_028127 [Trapa incisa]|uniref:Uncharacterized protein n=1 Tax=Trapa incisa TaxID=236973 RepID=A0AAN7KZ83_9MYRT|nr:hypothetical protein SAY87_028127 [Trapa incisa]